MGSGPWLKIHDNGAIKSGFLSLVGPITYEGMSSIFSKNWPEITFIIFKEKSVGKDGVTLYDFKQQKESFNMTQVAFRLKTMLLLERPLLSKVENISEKTLWKLTPFGKVAGDMMWKTLTYLTKKERGESVDEYALKIKNALQINIDAEDTEEKLIKQIEEENAKAAGKIQTETGTKIDLDKVQVSE